MTTFSPQKTRVWLVEDNVMFAQSVKRAVNALEGMSCDELFTSVEQAFSKLNGTSLPPDVVLLDVQLPGLDGISALEIFSARVPHTRILILTAFDDAEKIFRAVCAGAAGYILKSSGIASIGNAIRQVVEGGAPMSPAIARKVLDAFPRIQSMPKATEEYQLTERETEILRFLADGLQKKEIACALDISTHTVSTHLRRVYNKLQVNTNTGAVAKALRAGII